MQTIADELGCHLKTVWVRVARFNALGTDGLKDAPGRSRKARLTETERSIILGLFGKPRLNNWCASAMANDTLRMSKRKPTAVWTR